MTTSLLSNKPLSKSTPKSNAEHNMDVRNHLPLKTYKTLHKPLTTHQAFKPYTISTASYLAAQSLPLLLTPKLIVTMVVSEPRRITDLETYLCRSMGLTLLALSAILLPLTGLIPVTKTVTWADDPGWEVEARSKNPYAYPSLVVTTIYHALTAFHLYTQLTYGWNFAFTVGWVGSTALFCLGLWVILFGSDKARLSRSTGADKRTSNFPFRNEESASSVRKKEKEGREGKRRSVARTKSRD